MSDFDRGGAVEEPWSGMTQEQVWTLDGLGNWSSNNVKVDDSWVGAETRLDTSFNEYYSVGGTSQTHSDNGELTDDGTYEYYWDYMGRLISVRDKSTQAWLAVYEYYPDNRRLSKYIPGEGTTYYLYDGWRVIEEADETVFVPGEGYALGGEVTVPGET